MKNYLKNYITYRTYGLNHKEARLNALEDAEYDGVTAQDRVQLSWEMNKWNSRA